MTRFKAVLAADMDFTLLMLGEDIPPELICTEEMLRRRRLQNQFHISRHGVLRRKVRGKDGQENNQHDQPRIKGK